MSNYLTYGKISLEDVVIRSIRMEEHLTDDKFSVLYREYVITFAGHVNGGRNVHYHDNGGNVFRGGIADSGLIAQTMTQELSKPRQYFKLEMGGRVFLEAPVKWWHASDSAGGPFANDIQVASLAGNMDVAGGGGYFLVSGTIRVSVDGKSTSDGSELTYIQGYSIGWEYDIDGDTGYTTSLMIVHLHGRPEAIRSLAVNPLRKSVIGFGMAELSSVLQVYPGWKRKRCKLEVKPGGTEASIICIDEEKLMNTGSKSPAVTFEPIHSDSYRWSGTKEGAPQSALSIVIRASYSRETSRESVLKMMLYWVCIKGPGGLNGAGKKLKFVAYLECTVVIAYAQPSMELTVRVLTAPAINGAGGLPYSPSESRITYVPEGQDINDALAPYRVPGEQGPGFNPHLAYPALSNQQIITAAGEGFGGILRDTLQLDNPMGSTRLQPDGRDFYCGLPIAQTAPAPAPVNNTGGEAAFTYEEFYVDELTMPETDLGWKRTPGVYHESTWMSTKYKTPKGKMRMPTAGVVPSGSSTPAVTNSVEVSVHMPLTEKVVAWGVQVITTEYGTPTFPSPDHDLNPDKYTPKHVEVQPAACVAIGPGVYAWTITGRYVYDCEDEHVPGQLLSAGMLPTVPGARSDYNIPASASAAGFI